MRGTFITKAVALSHTFISDSIRQEKSPAQEIARINAVFDLVSVMPEKQREYFNEHTLDIYTLAARRLVLAASMQ